MARTARKVASCSPLSPIPVFSVCCDGPFAATTRRHTRARLLRPPAPHHREKREQVASGKGRGAGALCDDRRRGRPGQDGWPSGAGGAGSSPAGGALCFGCSDGTSGSLHREDGGVGHRKWHSARSAPWPATGNSGANQLRDCTRSSVRTAPAGGDGPPRPSTVRRSKRVVATSPLT